MFVILFVDCSNEGPYYRQTQLVYYFNPYPANVEKMVSS